MFGDLMNRSFISCDESFKEVCTGVDDSFWIVRGDSIDNVEFAVYLAEFIVFL